MFIAISCHELHFLIMKGGCYQILFEFYYGTSSLLHRASSIYQEKTSVRLFTQFNSFTPMSYEIGLGRCRIHRAFKISNSYIFITNWKKSKFYYREPKTLKVLSIIKLKPF